VAARPPGPSGAMTIGDVIRTLKQHIFLIIFMWIFCTAAAAALSVYLAKKHPSYKARAFVYVESPSPKAPMEFGVEMLQVELMDRFVADQAVLLTDEQVLDETVKSTVVRNTEWYKLQPTAEEALLELKDELSVKQIPNTSYLLVSFATQKSEDAPKIVNELIRRYLARLEAASNKQYMRELEDYKRKEEGLIKELDNIREDKKGFLSGTMTAAGAHEGLNIIGETWRALAAEVTRLESEKLKNKAAYENLYGVEPSQIELSPQMDLMIEQDTQVAGFQNQKLDLEQRLSIALRKMGKNHLTVQDLEAQLAVASERLVALRAAKEADIRTYQIDQANTAYLNAMQAELQLRDRMLEEESKQRDLDQALMFYRQLEEDQMLKEHQLTQIREYINLLDMILKDRGRVRVELVSQALTPKERSFPKHEINIPIGSFLGLLLGVGLSFLIELVDTSVKTSQDIVRHVHIPLLGTVPDLDDEELDIEQMELAAHSAPRSLIAEAFRAIRTNMQLSAPAERQRLVLVTSARPEEGKTSVAVNLAISMGQSGRRVLLIDANFRRPTLQQLFPNTPREGLSNLLIGQASFDELVTTTDMPNVDVLTSGPLPPNPTELLVGSYIQDLFTQVAGKYDQVIIDGPPILLVTDVLAMAGSVDGMILVCRAKTSSRGAILRAREQLERVNARIFGAVLNAARISRGGYFREQIRTYYDYQPEEALVSKTTPELPGQEDQETDQEKPEDQIDDQENPKDDEEV